MGGTDISAKNDSNASKINGLRKSLRSEWQPMAANGTVEWQWRPGLRIQPTKDNYSCLHLRRSEKKFSKEFTKKRKF
jgi:hypothetical protein